MIVNLYVDHLMNQSPTSAEQVWAATREHPRVFGEAAKQIGLTPAEYAEFRKSLLDGKAHYVRLPRRVDAMSGNRNGHIYAVRNAYMDRSIMGWQVALADGNVVYVPQLCGNISLLKAPVVAQTHEHHTKHQVADAKHVPVTQPPTTVAMGPGPVANPVLAPVTAAGGAAGATVATGAVAAAGAFSPLYAIPLVGGIIAAVASGGHSSNTPQIPSCNQGSNLVGACQK